MKVAALICLVCNGNGWSQSMVYYSRGDGERAHDTRALVPQAPAALSGKEKMSRGFRGMVALDFMFVRRASLCLAGTSLLLYCISLLLHERYSFLGRFTPFN